MRKTYEVTWANTVGCYGTDREGQCWGTFEAVGHTVKCAECGKEINRGWSRGKLGHEEYFCSKHIVTLDGIV